MRKVEALNNKSHPLKRISIVSKIYLKNIKTQSVKTTKLATASCKIQQGLLFAFLERDSDMLLTRLSIFQNST